MRSSCAQVQFDPASASFTAEEVMRHLQAVMGEHATPASLQIRDLLLSWDKGELPFYRGLSCMRPAVDRSMVLLRSSASRCAPTG